MLKVYGAQICIDCRRYKAIQKARGFAAEFIEITENTGNLKEFLKMRDLDPVLAEVKKRGGIGIPLFVNEDGQKSLDINEAMRWIDQEPLKEGEGKLLCKILKIEEDLDFGCEERPEGEPVTVLVTLEEENGFVQTQRISERYLYENEINEGDIVILEESGQIRKEKFWSR